jgi:hypothetical protein
MTNTQTAYFTKLTGQMIDYDRITDKELLIEHIEQIPDNKLKGFYEKLLKDKLTRKKGFISMITFINIAEIEVQKHIGAELAKLQPQIDVLFNKREHIQYLISNMKSEEKYQFISGLESEKTIFGTKKEPYFDKIEIFVIEKQFGWNKFVNPDDNYQIKEEIVKGFHYYLMQNYMVGNDNVKKLNND